MVDLASSPLFSPFLYSPIPPTLSILLETATKVMEQSGEEHPLTPITAPRALDRMTECYQTLQRELGPCHTLTLIAKHRVAICLSRLGRLDEAITMTRRCLFLRERILGLKHMDTLSSLHQLAIYLNKAGQTEEAIPMEERCLAVKMKARKKYLCKIGRMELGRVEQDEQKEKKEKKEKKERYTTIIDNTARQISLHRHCLAQFYNHVKRNDKAIELATECLCERRTTLGPTHKNTLSTQHQLAMYLAAADRTEEAIDMQLQVYQLEVQTLGADHPSTLIGMTNLAAFYNNANQYHRAYLLWKKCLDGFQRVVGPRHQKTLVVMCLLATVMNNLECKQYKHSACDLAAMDEMGLNEMDLNEMGLNEMGLNEMDLNEMGLNEMGLNVTPWSISSITALSMAEECWQLRRETLGDEHIDTRTSKYQVESFRKRREKMDEMALHEMALHEMASEVSHSVISAVTESILRHRIVHENCA